MDDKPRWKDLSARAKMRIVIMGAIQISLLSAALWDIRRRPAVEIRGSKALWTSAAFVNFVGPIAYFIFGRKPRAMLPEETPA